MKFPSPDTRAAVLRNPFVLAGLAVVVLLGVTAAVLVLIDSARGSNAQTPKVIIDQPTSTVGPTAKTAEATGVHGTAKQISAIRSAPGNDTPVLGTIMQDADVVIDGRTTDAHWYRVIYPPGSELHGWIDADFLNVSGDVSSLVVATAEPPVVIEVPTLPPTRTPLPVTPQATETPATPEAALPDLVVGDTPVISGGKLFITIVNQGTAPATGDLVVAVFNQAQTQILGGTTLPGFTLAPGKSIDVATGMDVVQDQTLLVIVDPNGTIAESDDTNNRALIRIAVSGEPTPGGPPTPTHTPQGAPAPVP